MKLNEWHKSVVRGSATNCVEVMETEVGFLVRTTKDEGRGPVLSFTKEEWTAFLEGVDNGEFDAKFE